MTTTFDTYERIHVERNGIVPMRLPAGEAFPLFQPEGERRWVAGWEPRYVHPAEPAVGEGVVFQTTTREAMRSRGPDRGQNQATSSYMLIV